MSESRGLIYLIQPDYLIGTNKYKIGCSRSTNLDCGINRYDKSIHLMILLKHFKRELQKLQIQ